jgi:hypothetical protein
VRGQREFEKLIHPVSVEEFFSTYWGQRYLHIPRNDPGYHHDVLTFDHVDEYLGRNDLRYPYIRLVKEGGELPLLSYAHNRTFGENLFQGNLDTDGLFREYAAGATMCMQLQHLALPTLGAFSRLIESYFGYRTQSTVFLTPGNSHGFTRHFDSHDFFTMGIKGEKTWRIYSEKTEYPLPRTEVLDSQVEISDALEREFQVKAGDTLYVPRGTYHDARSEDGSSMQISLGIFPYYWCDVLHTVIDKLADEHAALRMAVAPSREIDRQQVDSRFRELLALIADKADIPAIVEGLQAVAASKAVKETSNRLSDLDTIAELTPATPLVVRDVQVDLSEDHDQLLIRFYDKRISLPAFVRPQIDMIVTGHAFCADTLPPSLDLNSRLLLVRRLIEEGLLTRVEQRDRTPA